MSESNSAPFLLRRFQSLLGIIPVGAFFAEHAFTNGLAFFQGMEHWDEAVAFINGLPLLLFMEIFLIGVPIILHALIGIYIWIFCETNVQHYGYFRNWLYTLQRWTGIIAIVFIGYHVYKLRIEWHYTTDLHIVNSGYVAAYFHELWHVIFYFVGISAATFHFANGLWNFGVKWGITVGERAQVISCYICTAIGVAVYVFFMASLYAFTTA
ncbi:MAG: succinate dehydrogenase [bacterium]|nr:succinate dehydrogenase [bacterium]